MMASQTLSSQQKLKIIEEFELELKSTAKISFAETARKYGVSRSVMVRLWKMKEEIKNHHDGHGISFKQKSCNLKMVHEVEDFYGVYLLYCMNPKYKGRTYIGYTVDPNRRIKQHNTGAHAGGAYRTSGKGPWEMALIIHGFPNDISGLRFEWAWQHPDKSRRLRNVAGKSRKESAFQFRWRVVCNMLRTPPWSGLCLTIRWLKQDFKLDFPSGLEPPIHMPIQFGPTLSKKISKKVKGGKPLTDIGESCPDQPLASNSLVKCSVCSKIIQQDNASMKCLLPRCDMMSHMICLAGHFLQDPAKLLPVEGTCPKCHTTMLWGDLVRQRKGCYQNMSETVLQPNDGYKSPSPDPDCNEIDDMG